jgi:hypothetical protein
MDAPFRARIKLLIIEFALSKNRRNILKIAVLFLTVAPPFYRGGSTNPPIVFYYVQVSALLSPK